MIVVTGGLGLIGSNIISDLNALGREDIILIDDFKEGRKFQNINDCAIADYIHFEEYSQIEKIFDNQKVEAVFHMGACSDTTEWDGNYMMKLNFDYSKFLLRLCAANNIKFIYASSAAVYGHGLKGFVEDSDCEEPLNVYGYSKKLFDDYVVSNLKPELPDVCIGFRFFNVFGPRESHKGKMSSVLLHWYNQAKNQGTINIFGEYGGYQAGEHQRDFVYVRDCSEIVISGLRRQQCQEIFNLGTGNAVSYNSLAQIVLDWFKSKKSEDIAIKYSTFPDSLKNSYQVYTCADHKKFRKFHESYKFTPMEKAVGEYLDYLEETPDDLFFR